MTNDAALGYMRLAAKRLHLDKHTTDKLESMMREEMDFTTEYEAEQAYKSN